MMSTNERRRRIGLIFIVGAQGVNHSMGIFWCAHTHTHSCQLSSTSQSYRILLECFGKIVREGFSEALSKSYTRLHAHTHTHTTSTSVRYAHAKNGVIKMKWIRI